MVFTEYDGQLDPIVDVASMKPSESTASVRSNAGSDVVEGRKNGITGTGALLSFVKGMLGPGCLSIPLAFKQAGLLTAFVMVFVFGFLNNICMLKLVHASQYLCASKGYSELSYGDLAYEACADSFYCLRPYKATLRTFTNAMLVLLQMGICCVSYVFIAMHLQQVLEHLDLNTDFSVTTYMLLIFIPLVAINCKKTMKAIVYLSVVGNILMLISFALIFKELITADHFKTDLPWITSFRGMASAAGSILYTFEGQALVLPLENKLTKPDDMIGLTGVLSVGMCLVVAVNSAFGFFGYITFGENVKGSITLNLPPTMILTAVKVLITLIVYVGFVLQQYVIVETLWPTINEKLAESKWTPSAANYMQYVFRGFLVFLSMIVAIAVPDLWHIVPLVGTVCGMILAFVLPAFIDTIIFVPDMMKRQESKCSIVIRILSNSFFIVLGLFVLLVGLDSSIRDILNHWFVPTEYESRSLSVEMVTD